jgi:hypothetical protein
MSLKHSVHCSLIALKSGVPGSCCLPLTCPWLTSLCACALPRSPQIQKLLAGFPGHARAYIFFFLTIVTAWVMGLVVYGPVVWTAPQ